MVTHLVKMHWYDVYCLQLKEVRREVELSRRRSIKLKAQVDKLQENRDGVGWGLHRERVKVPHSTRPQWASAELCSVILIYFCSFSIPGHRGGSVRSAAAAPTDGAGAQPTWGLSRGEPPGRRPGPAAECSPQTGNHPHQTGKGDTCTQIKLLTLITSLQSQRELILVGMLPRRMFALQILME